MAARGTANREVVLTRVFEAPREIVWQAWTEPARLAAWWGPHGFTNPRCEADPRPGGAIRIDMRGPDGTVYPMTGAFRDVVAPERLVFTSAALDREGRPMFEVLNTVTFAADGGRTILTVHARVTGETGAAAAHLSGQTVGWAQSLERLTALVSGEGDLARVLVVQRVFEAPPGALFEAWTDPEAIARWWGPRRLTSRVERLEARPGGAWRIVQRDEGGREYAFDGEFREVTAPRRLVYSQRFEGHEVENTVRFRDVGGGRTEVLLVGRFASMGEREGAVGAGMESGVAEGLDRLAEALASGREIVMTRVLPAPRDLVFRMWTEPEHVVRWWGPRGFTTAIQEMDVRPGGAWRFVMRAPDGTEHPNLVRYAEIAPPDRLAYDHAAPPFRHEVTFTPRGVATEVTVRMRFPSANDREAAVRRFGALDGLAQTLGRLAEELAAAP